MTYDECLAAWPRRFDLPLDLLLPVWIAHTERHIGNHPKDPGRLTVYGLASATHPWVTEATTWEEAWTRGYVPEYIEPNRVLEMPPSLGFMLFELTVQHGAGVKIFQRCLGVPETGVVDDRTMDATQVRRGPVAVATMHTERERYVTKLDGWETFGRGWTLRYCDALEVALALGGWGAPEPANE